MKLLYRFSLVCTIILVLFEYAKVTTGYADDFTARFTLPICNYRTVDNLSYKDWLCRSLYKNARRCNSFIYYSPYNCTHSQGRSTIATTINFYQAGPPSRFEESAKTLTRNCMTNLVNSYASNCLELPIDRTNGITSSFRNNNCQITGLSQPRNNSRLCSFMAKAYLRCNDAVTDETKYECVYQQENLNTNATIYFDVPGPIQRRSAEVTNKFTFCLQHFVRTYADSCTQLPEARRQTYSYSINVPYCPHLTGNPFVSWICDQFHQYAQRCNTWVQMGTYRQCSFRYYPTAVGLSIGTGFMDTVLTDADLQRLSGCIGQYANANALQCRSI